MKKNALTLVVVVGILGALVFLNSRQPDRVAPERKAESEKAARLIEEADRLESQYAQNADENGVADAAPGGTPPAATEVSIEDLPEIPMPDEAQRYLFETTKGFWLLDVFPEWAPIGAARFEEAVEAGVYNDAGIFRVIPGFVIQFGIASDPEVAAHWSESTIDDEPVRKPNERGTITFAKSSRPNSRTTQLFISLGDNRRLDGMGFSPFGRVVHGMDVVENINAEYRESPQQDLIQRMGSAYLRQSFPRLDFITRVTKIADTTQAGPQ